MRSINMLMSGDCDRNSTAAKMSATSWSRAQDFISVLEDQIGQDPDVVFRGDALLETARALAGTAEAAFLLTMDTAVHARLSVAKKVDVAFGIDHLRVDPAARPKDDFISDDTFKIVETAAKRKQNLSWAQQGIFPGSHIGHFSQRPRGKSPPLGARNTGQQGRRGRGRGKGGKGKDRSTRGRGQSGHTASSSE